MSSAFEASGRQFPDGDKAPPVPWPGVLHDVRGAATAIEALAGLVADDAPALTPSSRGLLALIQARAEHLGLLCEAVTLLQGRPAGRLPLSRILPAALRRLQNFLGGGGVTLKSVGEIPDSEFEARALAVLVQSVLVAAVNARDASRPGQAAVEVHVVNGITRIVIELTGQGWGPAAGVIETIACPQGSAGLGAVGAGAHAALDRLDATLAVDEWAQGTRVTLDLPAPPSGPVLAPESRT